MFQCLALFIFLVYNSDEAALDWQKLLKYISF